jgi:hypothetical protein
MDITQVCEGVEMNELSFYEGYLEGKRRRDEIARKAVVRELVQSVVRQEASSSDQPDLDKHPLPDDPHWREV